MTNSTESVHAAKLLELGFKKFELSDSDEPAKITTVARELPEHEKGPPLYSPPRSHQDGDPCFTQIGGILRMTLAYDETGQCWRADNLIDLEPLGFHPLFDWHPLQ